MYWAISKAEGRREDWCWPYLSILLRKQNLPGNPLNKVLCMSHWSALCYMAITGGKGRWKSQLAEFSVFKFESSQGIRE